MRGEGCHALTMHMPWAHTVPLLGLGSWYQSTGGHRAGRLAQGAAQGPRKGQLRRQAGAGCQQSGAADGAAWRSRGRVASRRGHPARRMRASTATPGERGPDRGRTRALQEEWRAFESSRMHWARERKALLVRARLDAVYRVAACHLGALLRHILMCRPVLCAQLALWAPRGLHRAWQQPAALLRCLAGTPCGTDTLGHRRGAGGVAARCLQPCRPPL